MSQSDRLTYSDWKRLKTCGSKVQYSAPWVAANARLALSWVRPEMAKLEVYHCEYCDHEHLGNGADVQTSATTGADQSREGVAISEEDLLAGV